MIRIRLKSSIASADWAYDAETVLRAGTVFGPDEVPAELAQAWLRGGQAELMRDAPVETARFGAPEAAVTRRRRP